MEKYYLEMMDEIYKGNSEALAEGKEAIVDFFKDAVILTKVEDWLKEQMIFILSLPAATKDIKLEHKIMVNCYQAVLDKIIDYMEESNNECL